MQKNKYKYIIVGGGLSGLTSAFQFKLAEERSFVVLEARNRLGGRVNTQNEVDLGATWLHYNHTTVFNLLDQLKVDKFEQYNTGESYYKANSNAPTQTFHASADEVPSYRIKGGSSALIQALNKQLKGHVELETVVEKITEQADTLLVKTNKGEFEAEHLIVTVPPRLASSLIFQPALPLPLLKAMQETHGWFSHAIKVGLSYKSAFWRKAGQSGMVFGSTEVVTELYDHSNTEETAFSLMGFVNEEFRRLEPAVQQEKILAYLQQFLGSEVYNFIDFQLQDWTKEQFTTGEVGIHSQRNTAYGNRLFLESYLNGKLHFSGTETSVVHGGYLEGAVYSGLSLAQELLTAASAR